MKENNVAEEIVKDSLLSVYRLFFFDSNGQDLYRGIRFVIFCFIINKV